jgi:hypothetical protein
VALHPAAEAADTALASGVAALTEISTGRHPDNAALAKVVRQWPDPSPLARAQTIAEALINSGCGELVLRASIAVHPWALTLLAAAAEGVIYPGVAEVRAWAARFLWKLLWAYKACRVQVIEDEVRNAGGFDAMIVRGFTVPAAAVGAAGRVTTAPVSALEPPVYRAFMEMMLDVLTKPSDGATGPVETFGKLIAKPQVLRLIFRLLPTADWQVGLGVTVVRNNIF